MEVEVRMRGLWGRKVCRAERHGGVRALPASQFCPKLGIMKPEHNRKLKVIFLGKGALL